MVFHASLLANILEINPTYLISALVLIGLGILYLLQIRHYRRMERFAGEVRNIGDLRDELGQIKQMLKQADLQYPLHILEDLQEAFARIEKRLELPVMAKAVSEETEEHLDIRGAIEKYLLPRGFARIHLLADPPDPMDDAEVEYKLPIEAIRDGVSFKGHVIFREGKIVSERLKPAYEAFP